PLETAEPVRVARPAVGPGWGVMLRHLPVTLAILAITAAVAVWTGLGRNLHALAWLSFTPVNSMGQLAASPDLGQWWRLVSPIFMHFGIMHLAFNALWYCELGRRIELRSGSYWLLGLTLLFALVSNYAQWVFSGPTALFGGLSGVLYGLLGYCWLYQLLAPNMHFDLPKGVVIMMLAWLVFCLSGIISVLGVGAIPNAAHVGGLGVGCIWGAIDGRMARMRGRGEGEPPRGRKCACAGSHRGRCSYRSQAVVGAPSGCENVLARFAPRAVLLQGRNRGRSTRPGCENVLARFAPRAVLLQERNRGRSTRPGCEYVLAQVRTEGGAPTGA